MLYQVKIHWEKPNEMVQASIPNEMWQGKVLLEGKDKRVEMWRTFRAPTAREKDKLLVLTVRSESLVISLSGNARLNEDEWFELTQAVFVAKQVVQGRIEARNYEDIPDESAGGESPGTVGDGAAQ